MIAAIPRAQRLSVMAALLLGTLMTAMSTLIVTTALPVVIASLGGLELYSWAFAAALLAATISYPIAGKLSDLYGRRTLYLVGMATFIGGSVLSGASQSIEQLIAFRALQGIGAGTVQPTVSALIADLFALEDRGKWQGINGAIWGIASILGPILGGFLAEHVGWRWVFYVNVPFGLLAIAIMQRSLPRGLRRDGAVQFDFAGAGLLTAALLGFVLATLWGGNAFPWISPQMLVLAAGVAGLVVLFIRQEQQAAEPIVPLSLFKNRSFQTVIVLLFCSGFGMFGAMTYVPLYLQAVHGVSPTASGLLFLPTAVLTVGASVAAGFYMQRIGYRRLAIVTMAISAAGFAIVALAPPDAGVMPAVVGISLVGSAIGLSFPVLLICAQQAAHSSMVGVASSLVQLTRSLGGTLGVALLGAYMGARMADLIGGAVASPRDLVDVLRPEALAALSPGAVTLLRAELADTLRTMFAVGAVVMTTAAAFAFRLGHVEVVQRRSRRRAVERVSLPNVPIETDAGKL